MNDQTLDVYIKEEGYASFRFISNKAKSIAHKLKIQNSLSTFGDTFCGQPVWNPVTQTGLYQTATNHSRAHTLTKKLRKLGLIVESEIE